MPSSGTTQFSPDIVELLEEAYERAGLEMRSGYDFRTGVRSFNFLMAEWANRGMNLWTLEESTAAVTAGDSTYDVSDAVDVVEHFIRTGTGTSTLDVKLQRISVSEFSDISNKLVRGKPTQIFVQRLKDKTTLNLWPVPDQSYTLVYWKLSRLDDAGSATSTTDMPYRFLPALVSGLAYHIATKKPQAAARVPILKQIYEEQFEMAADEDRDRASVWLTPWIER